MRGLLDMFENPLTLGGLGLLSGGGWDGAMSGMRMGAGMQDRRRQQAEEDQRKSAFDGLVQSGAFPKEMAPFVGAMSRDQAIDYLAKTVDPNTKLERQYKQAQINKLNREAATGGETPANVREYQYFKSLPPEAQQQYLNLRRAQKMYDTGVEFVQPSAVNPAGPPVATIRKNPAEEERLKTMGRETAQGAVALPKTKSALDQYEIQTNTLKEDIGRALKLAEGATTTGMAGAVTSNIPGTAGYDLGATLNTIKANIGFDKLQAMRDASPTGGALGQVSEQENILLQSVLGALSQAQTKDQFVYNLTRLNGVVDQYRELKRRAYEQDVARFGAANVPNPDGGQSPQQQPAADDWRKSFRRVD